MNPNHYLAVAIHYLFGGARDWGQDVGIGKTLVSSTMIDLVAHDLGRRLVEVPVGFKWFVDGLIDGSLGFGGEESAGASFLRLDGTPWSTDKDGILLALLAAEITANGRQGPGAYYEELTQRHGAPAYKRVDSPIDAERKAKLLQLEPSRTSRRRRSRATRSPRCSPKLPATTRRSAVSRWSPTADGSPLARRVRRTSTSSTRRASRAKSI